MKPWLVNESNGYLTPPTQEASPLSLTFYFLSLLLFGRGSHKKSRRLRKMGVRLDPGINFMMPEAFNFKDINFISKIRGSLQIVLCQEEV